MKNKYFYFKTDSHGNWVPDTKEKDPPLVAPPHISIQAVGSGFKAVAHKGIDVHNVIVVQPAPETEGLPKRKKKKDKT